MADEADSPLLRRLALLPTGPDTFTGVANVNRWDRVFGGAIIAQALMAAYETVEDRPCHSLHAYFLLTGDIARPIHYHVTRLRDGSRFALRQIDVLQDGQRIAFVTASFQQEADGLEHQALQPSDASPPEALDDGDQRGAPAGIQLRNVDGLRVAPNNDADIHRMWCRSQRLLGPDPRDHQIAFAYASDFPLLPAILKPHDAVRRDPGLAFASLDHAIWFHRPLNFEDWLLCDLRMTTTGGQRGHAAGGVFTREGRLVASVAQEGFLRQL
jgi:acyl-CoA thioesterase-2